MKADFGRIGGSLALFEIKMPSAFTDSQKRYGLNGEQRNRGVEFNVFGEPLYGLRLNASATRLKAELSKTRMASMMVKQPSAYRASTRCLAQSMTSNLSTA